MIYLDYRDYIEHKHIGNISKRKAAGLLEPAVIRNLFFHFCRIFFQLREIKGSKEIIKGFIPADLLDGTVFMNQDFLMTKPAVVVIPHAEIGRAHV